MPSLKAIVAKLGALVVFLGALCASYETVDAYAVLTANAAGEAPCHSEEDAACAKLFDAKAELEQEQEDADGARLIAEAHGPTDLARGAGPGAAGHRHAQRRIAFKGTPDSGAGGARSPPQA
jgi:hypothetical protein